MIRATQRALPGFSILTESEALYHKRLRKSIGDMIRNAEERQRAKVVKGKERVEVSISQKEAYELLVAQDFRCALTQIEFWTDEDQGRYGPMCPSFDRILHKGPYSKANLRIVLLSVNSMRGSGSDADMYKIATALLAVRQQTNAE